MQLIFFRVLKIRRRKEIVLFFLSFFFSVCFSSAKSSGKSCFSNCDDDCEPQHGRKEDLTESNRSFAGDGLAIKYICGEKEGVNNHGHCTDFCRKNCHPELVESLHSSNESILSLQCKDRHVKKDSKKVSSGVNLQQMHSAVRSYMSCPEPKPCNCQCWCDPIQYGTPLPVAPTPFVTLAPPALSTFLETGSRREKGQNFLGSRVGKLFSRNGMEKQEANSMTGGGRMLIRRIEPIISSPPAFLPPPPLPPDRSFCPKAAACNCFCPCREGGF